MVSFKPQKPVNKPTETLQTGENSQTLETPKDKFESGPGIVVTSMLRYATEFAGFPARNPVLASTEGLKQSLAPHTLQFDMADHGWIDAVKLALETPTVRYANRIELTRPLRFRRNEVTDEEFENIKKLLNSPDILMHLKLQGLSFGIRHRTELVELIKKRRDLVELEISASVGVDLGDSLGLTVKSKIPLKKLFPSLTSLNLRGAASTGELDLSHLPYELKSLELSYNLFSGTFDPDTLDRRNLPQNIQELGLAHNQLDGSIDLTQLPSDLRILDLVKNKFSGPIDLTHLPSSLRSLYLGENQFSGPIDLTHLSSSLRSLDLGENQFSGPIDLTHLPSDFTDLNLGQNQFNGSVDLTQLPSSLVGISLEHNRFNGTLNLTRLPPSIDLLVLGDNQFSGPLDLSELPLSMQQIFLGRNQFSGLLDLVEFPGRKNAKILESETAGFDYIDTGKDGRYTGWQHDNALVRIQTIQSAAKNYADKKLLRTELLSLLAKEMNDDVRMAAATELAKVTGKDANTILEEMVSLNKHS